MLRTNITGAVLTALVTLVSGASMAETYGRHRIMASDRFYRAETVVPYGPVGACIPANGAQVLGGYASPTDLLDPVTGAICNPRRGFLPE